MVNFSILSNAYFRIAPGCLFEIPEYLREREMVSILLVTGRKSFKSSEFYQELLASFNKKSISYKEISIAEEPTPQMIDHYRQGLKDLSPHAIVAIGGGSVLDGGKALSALYYEEHPAIEYLEGVGSLIPSGRRIPLLAVPTTSGTGSEATKNAVLRQVGIKGFKKSLRHNNFIPVGAFIDSKLLVSCPKGITLQSGLDAFTQLLESFFSTKSNPYTDSLALKGLELFWNNFDLLLKDLKKEAYRQAIGLASYFSGLTLANAGLGTVHGMSGPLGGYLDIPHGLACAVLIEPVFNLTFLKMLAENHSGLDKLKLLFKTLNLPNNLQEGISTFFVIVREWTSQLEFQGLSAYGLKEEEIMKYCNGWGNKNNPVTLSDWEQQSILTKLLSS